MEVLPLTVPGSFIAIGNRHVEVGESIRHK